MSEVEKRTIIMRREGLSLVPVNSAEAEALDRLAPAGKDLEINIRRRRSNPHHSLYWARLGKLIESGATRYHDTHTLHEVLKFKLGYVAPFIDADGKLRFMTQSIAFDAMDQTEFNDYFAAAMQAIGELWHVNPEELV